MDASVALARYYELTLSTRSGGCNIAEKTGASLREHPDALRSVLLYAMEAHFGPLRLIWAEQQFEAVYGVSSRGFVERVAEYLE